MNSWVWNWTEPDSCALFEFSTSLTKSLKKSECICAAFERWFEDSHSKRYEYGILGFKVMEQLQGFSLIVEQTLIMMAQWKLLGLGGEMCSTNLSWLQFPWLDVQGQSCGSDWGLIWAFFFLTIQELAIPPATSPTSKN